MQYKLDRATYYYSLETFVSLSDVCPPLASLPRSAPLFPPPFFASFSRPLLFNLIIRPLSLSLSVRRFDRGSKREFVVDYYLLNASAKTDPGRI